jgi:hypothetical protein
MSYCNSCESNPCTCRKVTQGSTAVQKPTHSYQPLHGGPYLTKEQLGLNLYETVKTIGGIMGIDSQRAAAIHKGEGFKLQKLNRRRLELQGFLANQLPQLSNDEMDQVLERYPWVTGC